jgi:hypothetical protein
MEVKRKAGCSITWTGAPTGSSPNEADAADANAVAAANLAFFDEARFGDSDGTRFLADMSSSLCKMWPRASPNAAAADGLLAAAAAAADDEDVDEADDDAAGNPIAIE